jgi:tryptophan-rich sensory protein
MINIIKFIISIVICQLAGFIGSFVTRSSVNVWFRTLEKPNFYPPPQIFAPVWIALYLIMGIAFFLIWKKSTENSDVKYAMIVFIVQLVFNTLWSLVFFGLHSISGGMIVIIILWFLILTTIFSFYKISHQAAYLLIPYILWVSFAAVLNFAIWKLN